MRRLRVLAVPFLTLPLLVVAGCAGSGTGLPLGAGGASPSASVLSTPSPSPTPTPSPTPSPVPAPVPTTPCTVTAGLDTKGLTGYLKGLRSSDRPAASDSSALFMVDSGVWLGLRNSQRPCEAVPVKLSHVRVEMTKSSSSAGYKFTYGPIDTRTLAVGPDDGLVRGSVPPAPSGCGGALSILYVGQELAESELPEHLSLPTTDSTLDWTLVDVSVDRVLDAVFKPPPGAKSC
ncbi:hypothetical protein [Streptomyces sp. NBC_00503]|uniref:hypothetical protein n=1 Tax=Streptomyces sp. NBC_00503 TaxID=2903659 RepID=UPI002E818841|nr:hypothetical protein [Streptomyces sp. NBC_00503]WUD80833.1 hypothetical protein OG490_09900 [Streptomyces sp. NBC_00503]